MMSYRDIIKSAFDDAEKLYPCSDHDTAFRNITERAKNMKRNNNDNRRELTEIIVPEGQEKKHNKALIAAVSVLALSAAGAGIFALGGIRSDSIASAPYSGGTETVSGEQTFDILLPDDVTTEEDIYYPEEETSAYVSDMYEENITSVLRHSSTFKDCDISYELDDGRQVHISGFDFDSIIADVYYEVIYPEDMPIPENKLDILPMRADGSYVGSGFFTEGSSIIVRSSYIFDRQSYEAEIPFTLMKDRAFETKEIFRVKVTCLCDTFSWLAVKDTELDGVTATLGEGYISPGHIVLRFTAFKKDGKYMENAADFDNDDLCKQLYDKDIVLTLSDGSQTAVNRETKWSFADGNGNICIAAELERDINPNDVTAMTLGDTEILRSDYLYQIFSANGEKNGLAYPDPITEQPLFESEEKIFDCGDRELHLLGYTFDGITLRLRYNIKYSPDYDYEKNGGFVNLHPKNDNAILNGGREFCPNADSYTSAFDLVMYFSEPTDSAEITFIDALTHEPVNASFTAIADSAKTITIAHDEAAADMTIHHLVLSESGISIVADCEYCDGITAVIRMKDGSTVNAKGSEGVKLYVSGGKLIDFLQTEEPLDIAGVEAVTINGAEIRISEQ